VHLGNNEILKKNPMPVSNPAFCLPQYKFLFKHSSSVYFWSRSAKFKCLTDVVWRSLVHVLFGIMMSYRLSNFINACCLKQMANMKTATYKILERWWRWCLSNEKNKHKKKDKRLGRKEKWGLREKMEVKVLLFRTSFLELLTRVWKFW